MAVFENTSLYYHAMYEYSLQNDKDTTLFTIRRAYHYKTFTNLWCKQSAEEYKSLTQLEMAKALEDDIGAAQMAQLGQLQGQASMGGSLGSARQDAANSYALSKTAGEMAASELANRRNAALQGAQGVIGSGSTIGQQMGQGISATEGVGSAIQQQNQNQADAGYQGLQRLFGLYGMPAVGSKTEQISSGGGK